MAINADRDYIRCGSCSRCRRQNVSIVVHHPQNRKPYSICSYCSRDTWLSVGESNRENYLKYGEVTKPREGRTYARRNRNPHYKREK